MGIDRVTANLARAQVDMAFRVSDAESVAMARHLLQEEGLDPPWAKSCCAGGGRPAPPRVQILVLLPLSCQAFSKVL